MKIRKHHIIGTLAIATALTLGLTQAPSRVGPDNLYPDMAITPGKVNTSDFGDLTRRYEGLTYSQYNRKVSSKEKKLVCQNYPENCKGTVEIDHFCPLALGCSNDITNLWAQPEVNVWKGQDYGFHAKDKLESYLVIQMKKGIITPKAAQDCILRDWVKCYNQYIPITLGAVDSQYTLDPDDNE